MFFDVVDDDLFRADAAVVTEGVEDESGAFEFVFEVRGVDEDELVVIGGELDVFFEDEELVAAVFIEADFANSYLTAIPQRATFLKRLRELQDYDKLGVPHLAAGRLFYSKKQGLQNQAVVYWREDRKDATDHVLFDPNTLSKDGTIALGGYDLSEDGALAAYSLSEAGSDWVTIRVRDVTAGKELPDVIRWVKFSGPSWSKDGKGFYYSRYAEPEKGSELKAENYNQKVYYHSLGQHQRSRV